MTTAYRAAAGAEAGAWSPCEYGARGLPDLVDTASPDLDWPGSSDSDSSGCFPDCVLGNSGNSQRAGTHAEAFAEELAGLVALADTSRKDAGTASCPPPRGP